MVANFPSLFLAQFMMFFFKSMNKKIYEHFQTIINETLPADFPFVHNLHCDETKCL